MVNVSIIARTSQGEKGNLMNLLTWTRNLSPIFTNLRVTVEAARSMRMSEHVWYPLLELGALEDVYSYQSDLREGAS